MKRSEINKVIREAEVFFAEHRFLLPPFASWTPEKWKQKGAEANEIRDKELGWDVTDLAGDDYYNIGLLLFTIRNGSLTDDTDMKNYAEKIMVVRESQVTPWHFHWQKTEDIINRGGGNLVLELAWATEDESALDDRDVHVQVDGVARTVKAKGKVTLAPGDSISLPPMLVHTFYGEASCGTVLVGEVSNVNDDNTDNGFLEPLGRFPEIDEDEEPYRLLCNEYPPAN